MFIYTHGVCMCVYVHTYVCTYCINISMNAYKPYTDVYVYTKEVLKE